MKNKYVNNIIFAGFCIILLVMGINAQARVITASSQIMPGYYVNGAHILLSNYYRRPGESFTVNGKMFAPGENVKITAMGMEQTVVADPSGVFNNADFIVPFSAINSHATVRATGQLSHITRSAKMVIGTFYPFVEPSSYYVILGSNVSFHGIRFAPGEEITITGPNIATMKITADFSGSFSTPPLALATTVGETTYTFIGSLTHIATYTKVVVGQFY